MSRTPALTGVSDQSLRDFAHHIAQGESATEAARRAGFPSCVRPRRAMESARFRYELRRAISDRLEDHVPEIVDVLMKIVRDEKAPARVRVDAGKAVMDRAGYVASAPAAPVAPNALSMEDLTAEELEGVIARLKRESAEAARLVNAVPIPEPSLASFLD